MVGGVFGIDVHHRGVRKGRWGRRRAVKALVWVS